MGLEKLKRPARFNKCWTDAEKQVVFNNWGTLTPSHIAKMIDRSTYAVVAFAKNNNLGMFLENSEYMNKYQITQALGIDSHVIERTWIPNYGFKMQKKMIRSNVKHDVISVENLLKYLENHQHLFDTRRMEEYALGTEPEWLRKKRIEDRAKPVRLRGKKYTPEEDTKICMYIRAGKTQQQIAELLGTSKASINARVQKLDVWGTMKLKTDWRKNNENNDAI